MIDNFRSQNVFDGSSHSGSGLTPSHDGNSPQFVDTEFSAADRQYLTAELYGAGHQPGWLHGLDPRLPDRASFAAQIALSWSLHGCIAPGKSNNGGRDSLDRRC
jgi:hypothetical protein